MRVPYLLLFLLFAEAAAAEVMVPCVSSMQLEVLHNGTVETPRFRLEKVSFELLMPQRDVNQVVFYDGEIRKDELGNQWSVLSFRNPPKDFSYSTRFFVNVSAFWTDALPSEYEITDELRIYLKSSESIQSDDPQIKALASSLTANSRTGFEKVAVLAKWVHDNVKYDQSLSDSSQDALWVLDKRVGTCDEYTTLFIALARAVGIPARFVAGYYYNGKTWEKHAFAEVYLGKWVPVDPTNLDVGRLDAAHLKFAVSDKNVVGSKVKVYGAEASKIRWSSNTSIRIINYTETRNLDYDLRVSANNISAGDSVVVLLKVRPNEYAFLRATLNPCFSDFPFVEADSESKDAILQPGKESILYWRLDVSKNLPKNMLYLCPLSLYSKMFYFQDINLSVVSSGKREKPLLRAELSDTVVGLGRNQTVFLSFENLPAGEVAKVGVLAGEFFKELYLSGREHAVVSFKPENAGINEVLVYSSTGSVSILNYLVKETGDIYIDSVELPELMLKSEYGKARVFIKNTRPIKEEVKAYMSVDSSESIRTLSVSDLSMVEFPLKFNDVGVERIVFRITGRGFDSGTVRYVRVYDIPKVSVDAVYHPNKRITAVTFDVSGDVIRDVKVSVGGLIKEESELFGKHTIEFNSTEDASIEVYYEDASGKEYRIRPVLRTQQENFIESVSGFLGWLMRLVSGLFSLRA